MQIFTGKQSWEQFIKLHHRTTGKPDQKEFLEAAWKTRNQSVMEAERRKFRGGFERFHFIE